MRWSEVAAKSEWSVPAASRRAGTNDRPLRLLGALEEDELDRSRPVPWDWPEPKEAA